MMTFPLEMHGISLPRGGPNLSYEDPWNPSRKRTSSHSSQGKKETTMLIGTRPQTPRNRTRAWHWTLGVMGTAILTSCAGVGHTLGSFVRSSPDYDELDSDRESRSAPADSREKAESPEAFWTQYRGPRSDGIYDESDLAFSWPEGKPPKQWSAAVGPAYSSVVVANGLVITMEQRRDREAVVAFDLEDGALAWEQSWPGRFHDVLSKEGPRATPAVQGDSVVTLGALGELRCLDLATGSVRWRRNLLQTNPDDNLHFGLSASPRILEDVVYVQGGTNVSAFDLQSGKWHWTTLDETMAYATPQFGEILGRTHLVVCAKKRIIGLDAEKGTELWSFPWKYLGDTCTQPLVLKQDRVLASSGYGKGSQLVQLEQGATGIEPKVVWRSSRFKTRYNEPVLQEHLAFGLDEGTLTCIDVDTGKRLWKEGRYGYGQLLRHRDHLLVVDEDGQVHVLRVNSEGPTEVASFEGVDGGMTLNLPALAHGRLFIRNEKVLMVYDLRGSTPVVEG